MTVPDGIVGVTAEWLTDVLSRPVGRVTCTPIGTGQTGCTYRLQLGDGTTLVAKTGAEDPAVRERVAYGYRAELGFYRDIAPTVDVPVAKVLPPSPPTTAASSCCSWTTSRLPCRATRSQGPRAMS